jgi:hypothetical protein
LVKKNFNTSVNGEPGKKLLKNAPRLELTSLAPRTKLKTTPSQRDFTAQRVTMLQFGSALMTLRRKVLTFGKELTLPLNGPTGVLESLIITMEMKTAYR